MPQCTLYPKTRTGFEMVLSGSGLNWQEKEQEFKDQLAGVGIVENRDYYQDNSGKYIESARPFIVNGVAKVGYVLIKMPQDMIAPSFYKRTDGRDINYAMDGAKTVAEMSISDFQEGDDYYLDFADGFLAGVLKACVENQVHSKFQATAVTNQLNSDLEKILQIKEVSFFENPRYLLAYSSLYKAIQNEKVQQTTKGNFVTSIFQGNQLVKGYKQLMDFYSRDCSPGLKNIDPNRMLEIYDTYVTSIAASVHEYS
ncbi:MAG: hypothetical protein P1U74_04705 [Legionellaceae bacterium]|nr:hypothetical protein [Legionellaceae bacterium]